MIKYSLIGRVGKKKSVPSKKQNKKAALNKPEDL